MRHARQIFFAVMFLTPCIAVRSQTPAASTQPKPAPIQVPAAEANKLAIHKVAPRYPEAAKRSGISGSVVVQVAISHTGTVSGISVLSGPVELQQAAIEAVTQWTFRPFLLDGVPSDIESTITINFALQKM